MSTTEPLPTYNDLIPKLTAASERLDYDSSPPRVKEHEKWTEITVMSHALTHDAKTFRQYLEVEAGKMPETFVRIRGTHKDTWYEDSLHVNGTKEDFDITISLREQLAFHAHWKLIRNTSKAYRGSCTKSDGLSSDLELNGSMPSLDEWCKKFCTCKGSLKEFAFSSRVVGLENAVPVNAIKQIVRDVKYKGDLEVSVHGMDRTTTVMTDDPLAHLRVSWYYWILCCIPPFWAIMWLLTNRWEVLTIEWPTRASQSGMVNPEDNAGKAGSPNRWLDKWKLAISRAALGRLRKRIESAENEYEGRRWKPLGDFDEVREWGIRGSQE